MLIDHMKEGLGYEIFAATAGVCDDTLREWESKHPDFSAAKKLGKSLQAEWWVKLGRAAAAGKVENFNATAFVWCTKNMLGWRDKQDVEISGKDGGPIKTIAMNINADAQSLTDGELRNAVLKAIANKQEDTHDQIERTAPNRISD